MHSPIPHGSALDRGGSLVLKTRWREAPKEDPECWFRLNIKERLLAGMQVEILKMDPLCGRQPALELGLRKPWRVCFLESDPQQMEVLLSVSLQKLQNHKAKTQQNKKHGP